jgi:hypothetical protein
MQSVNGAFVAGRAVKSSRRISKKLAGWPDCGERFRRDSSNDLWRSQDHKSKTRHEGRALFGAEAPEIQSLDSPEFPKNSSPSQPAIGGVCPDFKPLSGGLLPNPNGGIMFTINALPKHLRPRREKLFGDGRPRPRCAA